VVAAAVLTAGAIVLPVGVAAQIPPGPPIVGGEPIDPDASAALEWSVPERYDASWKAWSQTRHTYDRDFVTPPQRKGWSIILDACGSRAVRRIERYTFVLTGLTDPAVTRTLDSATCKRRLTVPSLGLYRVETTVHTALGASVTLPSIVRLRDYLIVSIGDSLSSGEGVPDRLGSYSYKLTLGFSGFDVEVHTTHRVLWKDRRCHRSAFSGPALAARAIEKASHHTSVTFVSFACSGAELKHLDISSNEGAESQPPGTGDLLPQTIAASQLLGSDPARRRQIDALLVTGGINDLGFSDIVTSCATNNNHNEHHTDCVYGSNGAHLVNTHRFERRYDLLASAVRHDLPRVREVYISGYPRQVFLDGACGLLGGVIGGAHIPYLGIDRAEGNAMNTLGIALNRQVEGITIRHRDEGWNYVEDPTMPFLPHRYCGNEPWFNSLEKSLLTQGDQDGTAHPNRAGHRAFGGLLGRAIVPDQPGTPFRDTTLTIDAVKLKKGARADPSKIKMTLRRYPRDPTPITRTIGVLPNGQWALVRPQLGTFAVPVFREPASPRHATEIRLELIHPSHGLPFPAHRLSIHHGFADGYGPGPHELTHSTGDLAVRYHIDVRGPTTTPPTIGS
jgi:hypothetical protein